MPWKSYLLIIRPVNLAIMALVLILVRYAIFIPVFRQSGLDGLMPWWQFALLVLATLLIGAGGYVINDVLDIELDKVNKPGKQIIGKKISEAAGNNLHFNLTAAGVIIGLAFSYLSSNIFLGILFVIIATALYYYSYKYKYLPFVGNFVVALLAAMVVLIYWLFEFYYLKNQPEIFVEASLVFPRINRYVFAFALFAFITSFLREIVKDTQDIKGDSRFGCRTLPVVMGLDKIRYLLVFLTVINMGGLAWFQYVLFRTDQPAMAFWLISTQVLLSVSAIMTLKSREPASFGRLSTIMKIIMLSGLTSLIMIWF